MFPNLLPRVEFVGAKSGLLRISIGVTMYLDSRCHIIQARSASNGVLQEISAQKFEG